MKYHYLRLSLLPMDRPPILEATRAVPDVPNREQYLRHLFSQRTDFKYRNRILVYVPTGTDEIGKRQLMLGRIGRSIASIENAPPEDEFKEITQPSWRAANFIVDISDHPDGQKIAFQHHSSVGRPLSILAGLINHINSVNPDSGWIMEINIIAEKTSFWDAARQHKGEITTAEFSFVTPNVLGVRTKLNEDLKKLREKHNATTVTETIRNPKGHLELTGEDIEDSVEYISEGGGKPN